LFFQQATDRNNSEKVKNYSSIKPKFQMTWRKKILHERLM